MLVPYFVAMNRTVLTVVLVAALFTGGALIFVWYVSFGMGRPSDGVSAWCDWIRAGGMFRR